MADHADGGSLGSAGVVILAGPIRSGKTTALSSWVERLSHAGPVTGILAPVVDGSRRLCSIATGEWRTLDAATGATSAPGEDRRELTRIGPHAFYTDVFRWAQAELEAAIDLHAGGGQSAWVVVDEVGPLELRGEGLEPAAGLLLRRAGTGGGMRVLLVVREALVERVCEHYGLGREETAVVSAVELNHPRISGDLSG